MKTIILGISLTLLFAGAALAAGGQGIEVEQLLKTTKSWDGEVLPRYPKGQPEITILKITIAPGSALPMHKHPFINAGIVTKGNLTVEKADGKLLYLKAGDSIAELVNQWHRGKNEGSEPVEIIVFYAGVRSKPVTVKKE